MQHFCVFVCAYICQINEEISNVYYYIFCRLHCSVTGFAQNTVDSRVLLFNIVSV